MLRRPSGYHATPREEGCSSTAFEPARYRDAPVWNNPAIRGSGFAIANNFPALP